MVRLGNQPSTNPVGTLAAGRLTRVSSIWSWSPVRKGHMHYMSYVLVPKTEASSSLEARQYVMEELTDDPSFMGEGGRFFEPVCDWFVTGGRWSGRLCPKTIRDEFWKQANQLLEPERYGYLGIDESEIQANRKQLVD